MNYENGEDIFPKPLLRQIQKYVSGKLVYIPVGERKKAWGEATEYKMYLYERNQSIKARFKNGDSIALLSEEYFLSDETIKKIIYSKKEDTVLQYECTLTSSLEYGKAGEIEKWIHEYLLSDGQNKEFSDGLKLFDR